MEFKKKLIAYIMGISIFRLVIFILIDPTIHPDTQSYIELAKSIVNNDFNGFNGLRTPGYSFIIILAGFNLKVTILIQMIFGIIISYLIAYIIYESTNREYLSLLASSLYSIFIPFLFFEVAILSETTAAFFILLSFTSFIRLVKNKDKYLLRVFLISIFTLMAVLTRPVYLAMVPLYFFYLIFVFIFKKLKIGQSLKYMTVFTLPVLIGVFGWSYVNFKYNDTFTFATGRGFAAMEMAGDFIEQAPDGYPYNIIKDVYIRERDKNIKNGAPHIDTIWGITDELQEKTGLSYNELSQEVRKMCMHVMLKNPSIYIKSVIRSMTIFWKTFGILILTESNTSTIIKYINIIQRLILILLQIPFLLSPLVYFIKRKRVKHNRDLLLICSFVYILIITISILISIIECTEGRFAMPTYSLLIIVTFTLYYNLLGTRKVLYK